MTSQPSAPQEPSWDTLTSDEDDFGQLAEAARRRRQGLVLLSVASLLCVSGLMAVAVTWANDRSDKPQVATKPAATATTAKTTAAVTTTATPTRATPDTTPPTSPPANVAPPAVAVETFSSPSGRIKCAISTDFVKCDVEGHQWAPGDGERCAGVDIAGVVLVADGPRIACGGQTGGGPVLAYGATKQVGEFKCTSSDSGMSCEHTGTRKRFTLARGGVNLG